MSHAKVLLSPGGISQEYSKSSSKRLFASVFRILDHDDLEISSFDHADTNGSKVSSMLTNTHFLQSLQMKMKQDHLLDTYPILKVQCIDRKGHTYPIDIQDLAQVFSSFSKLYTVYSSKNELTFYALYTSFASAYVAMKLLNGFTIRHSLSQLMVNWCPTQDYDNLNQFLGSYHSKVQWNWELQCQKENNQDKQNKNSNNNGNSKQCKLTCRYDIQIENQKEFQVARRIIGAKGINMKKIIEGALDSANDKNNANSNQLLKLRLRGKGSGYKQGPEQLESEEELHLCISAKYQSIYARACQSVEKLLENVYAEYQEFTKRQGKTITLEIRKSQLSSQPIVNCEPGTKASTSLPLTSGRMDAQKIEQYLQLRNKARRQLNFAQADRIRNYLRACGVCLIDEKGRRGKATQVTTWKYLL